MTAIRRRPRLLLYGLAILAMIAGAALVLYLLGRTAFPPRRITLATGPEGGAYNELGKRYVAELAREGIQVALESTSGDLTNLSLLRDPKGDVAAAFVTGGITTEADAPDVESLGTIAYQPLWIFCRGSEPGRLKDLKGKRVSVGGQGGGTRQLMQTLLDANELTENVRTVALTPAEARDALDKREIDCAAVLTTADAPVVKELLADERFQMMDFERADAYVALYPHLRKLVLPEGVGNLPANRPPHDIQLVASPASLLVRGDLHPGIQYLLLEAARRIQSGAGIFQKTGEFPAPEVVDLPLSAQAEAYYKSGGNFLQRHLPFWLWVFAARLLLVIIPLAGIIYPLAKGIPFLIDAWVNRRLNALYTELREIEARGDSDAANAGKDLANLEERIRATRVPNSYARHLYTLEQHAGVVRERLERSTSPSP